MRETTLFNIQYFASILFLVGVTALNVFLVPLGGVGDSFGFIVLVITIPLNILFGILTLVYKKIRYRTYTDGGRALKIFWIISLLWLLILSNFAISNAMYFLRSWVSWL